MKTFVNIIVIVIPLFFLSMVFSEISPFEKAKSDYERLKYISNKSEKKDLLQETIKYAQYALNSPEIQKDHGKYEEALAIVRECRKELSEIEELIRKELYERDERVRKAINEKKPTIGMTKEELIKRMGKPSKINYTHTSFGEHEQCIYRPGADRWGSKKEIYVYVEDGYVTSWSE